MPMKTVVSLMLGTILMGLSTWWQSELSPRNTWYGQSHWSYLCKHKTNLVSLETLMQKDLKTELRIKWSNIC